MHVLVAAVWWQESTSCLSLPLNLPGVLTKMCLQAWILWWWKQPILTRTGSIGQCQGTYGKICLSSLLYFLSRLSVSSMDLSQPSVATRKEYWEGQAKSREPCRNCQVASVPFSLRTKHWMTFFRSRCQQRWTFPATGVNGSERLWWASFVPNWHPVLLHSMKWQGFVDLSEQ